MLKKSVFLAGACLILAAGAARAQEVAPAEPGPALSLMISGQAQFWWQMVQADPGRQAAGVNQLRTRRVHLYFDGRAAENLDYSLSLEMDGDSQSPGVYEAWIKYRPVAGFSLKMGTFLPPWTLTMPRSIHDQDFVRYPLIVDNQVPFFTPWRQTGVLGTAELGDFLTLSTGLFNGLDRPNSFVDNNNMKDTMVSARINFYPGMGFVFGHWGGKSSLDPALAAIVGVGTVKYNLTWIGFEAAGGSWLVSGEAVWDRTDGDGQRLVSAQGYHLSAVYSMGKIEALARYELLEPNIDDTGAGAADELEWTTLGLNYAPLPQVKIMGNYIFKAERLDNQRANDELLFQVSLAF